ncbi:MAG: CBS domain-containing protein [Chloroflexi bacterium]|nr:CBS domain-containing protein [Chloroflexota bacterium]
MSARLILTHENADFDAFASMLGMYKLDPTAIPVLPPHLNRNVRNFITLYAHSLMPLRQHQDMHRQRIERVYVVDSQSFNNVRGIRSDTPLHFIDHHPLERKLGEHDSYEGDRVGANTTLLVEKIRARGITITPPEATTFMLGIYEDTGSLTFGETTARDIHAAAWLLDQGANLDKVRDFLSHPLTDEQHELYDELLENLEFMEISGHSIIIASATVDAYVPEISSIAQRLRDLYDPGAIIMVVKMGRSVQFIGRSTVDEIDISRLARHFGGGGHRRASAAIMRDARLVDILQQVHEMLPQAVEPSVRVRDLMSTGQIFTISHETTIGKALEMTRHITHEGFPVVRDSKVIGLLTRQALDRARNHGMLSQPVTAIMEAGEITVTPQDSLETLRRAMMESGWGQMPVVDARGLVGIVTRTDLIRLWSENWMRPDHHDSLLTQLQDSLPAPLWQLVEFIMTEAQAQDIGLYLVGGFVRDLLLNRPNFDIDFVVETNAIGFVEHLHRNFGGDMRQHQQFNTAKWILDNQVAHWLGLEDITGIDRIDFATARTEFYDEPTILPTVRQSSIKLDLHRRDFTINALAIRLSPPPAGELLDYYNGKADLENGIIRVLHSLSFVDDPTRMMRAVRFEQRFQFRIEPRTEELIKDAIPLLDRVSGDRLRNELNLIMAEMNPLADFRRLDELGILSALHPELKVDTWFEGACRALMYLRRHPRWDVPEDFDNWRVAMFGLLTARISEKALNQLQDTISISRPSMRHLHDVRRTYQTMSSLAETAKPGEIYSLLHDVDHTGWLTLWAAMPFAYQRRFIERFVQQWQHVKPIVSGTDILEMGVKPGPIIGDVLWELRRAWLDGDIATADEEKDLLARLIDEFRQ